MKIEPTYITFEQAKLLEDKEYKNGSRLSYDPLGNLTMPYFGDSYTNGESNGDSAFEAPEQWQVVEWLRVKYGIWIVVDCYYHVELYAGCKTMRKIVNERHRSIFAHRKSSDEHKTPQEAYSAAFDYILTNLI
jgi:hypothetical protein